MPQIWRVSGALQDLGIDQTWGIKERDRLRKSLVAMTAPAYLETTFPDDLNFPEHS